MKKTRIIACILLLSMCAMVSAQYHLSEGEIQREIGAINNSLDLVSRQIQRKKFMKAKETIREANIRMNRLLGSLHQSILKIRKRKPAYRPRIMPEDIPAVLRTITYDEENRKIAAKLRRAQKDIERARIRLRSSKSKATLSILIAAWKTGKNAFTAAQKTSTGDVYDGLKTMYNDAEKDAKAVKGNIDEVHAKRKVLRFFQTLKEGLGKQHHEIVAMRDRIVIMENSIRELDRNIKNIRTHVNAASLYMVERNERSSAHRFDHGMYTTKLANLLKALKTGKIQWNGYFRVKKSIKTKADNQYRSVVKALQGKLNGMAVRQGISKDYNRFNSYYYSFDRDILQGRRKVLQKIRSLGRAWQTSVRSMLVSYGRLNFNGFRYPVVDKINGYNIVRQNYRKDYAYMGYYYSGILTCIDRPVMQDRRYMKKNTLHTKDFFAIPLEYPHLVMKKLTNYQTALQFMRRGSSRVFYSRSNINEFFPVSVLSQATMMTIKSNVDKITGSLNAFALFSRRKLNAGKALDAKMKRAMGSCRAYQSYISSNQVSFYARGGENSYTTMRNQKQYRVPFGKMISIGSTPVLIEYINDAVRDMKAMVEDMAPIPGRAACLARDISRYIDAIISFNNDVESEAGSFGRKSASFSSLMGTIKNINSALIAYRGMEAYESSVNKNRQLSYIQSQYLILKNDPSLRKYAALQKKASGMVIASTGTLVPVFPKHESAFSAMMAFSHYRLDPDYLSLREFRRGFPKLGLLLKQVSRRNRAIAGNDDAEKLERVLKDLSSYYDSILKKRRIGTRSASLDIVDLMAAADRKLGEAETLAKKRSNFNKDRNSKKIYDKVLETYRLINR